MDAGSAGQWASAIMSMIAFATAMWAARSKRHEDQITALRLDLGRAFGLIDGCAQRLTKIEGELAHMPSKDITHRLENGMERLEGELRVLAESLKPVARISDRLQEFLLEQASRK